MKKAERLFLLLFALMICCTACQRHTEDAASSDLMGASKSLGAGLGSEELGTYTVMVYMVGSNLESEGMAASNDILEMIDSGADLSRINVILYTGGSAGWALNIPNTQNSIYLLSENSDGPTFSMIASTNTAENMGEADTLADFLDFCYEEYPADHYGLIFWDHGSGPVFGFGNDELFDYDSLLLPELEEALSRSPFGGSNKIDWVGYDACLMASMELAALWDDYAEYLIASQETEPAFGWDYSFLSILNETSNAEIIGKQIIDTYADFYAEMASAQFNPEITLSCMDLSRTGETAGAMNKLFDSMLLSLREDQYSELARARDSVKCFGLSAVDSKGESLDLVDVGDLAEVMEDAYPQEAAALRKQLDDFVVYEKSNVRFANGVSLYYPYDNKLYFEKAGRDIYEMMPELDGYGTYVKSFTDIWLNGESNADWRMGNLSLEAAQMTLQLTEEQMQSFSSAYYTVLWETGDNAYTPLLAECRVEPDENGVLHVSLDQELIYANSSVTQAEPWMVAELESDEQEILYQVKSTALQSSVELTSEVYMNVYITLKVDRASGEVTIQSVNAIDERIAGNGKSTVDLTDWFGLEQAFARYIPDRDQNGLLKPYTQWTSDGWYMWNQLSIDENIGFTQKRPDGAQHFAIQIVVKDTNGKTYASELCDLPDTSDARSFQAKTGKGEATYLLYADHAVLAAYTGEDEALEIPGQVEGLPVTSIGPRAIAGSQSLRKLTLPETLIEIGEYALYDCRNLQSIQFSEGLERISYDAFGRCFSLENVVLPSSVSYIGRAAFSDCDALRSITIPAGVQTIERGAILQCENLQEIVMQGAGSHYKVVNGVLFSADGRKLIIYPAAKGTEYTIPEGTTTICYAAFVDAEQLQTVRFPSTLTTIESHAFSGCKGLCNIALPNSLQRVGFSAFDSYIGRFAEQSLPITLGENVKYIGYCAFSSIPAESFEVAEENPYYTSADGLLMNKSKTTVLSSPARKSGSVTLPESTTTVAPYAFEHTDITELILPDSLTSISNNAGCPFGLEHLSIGAGLTEWDYSGYNKAVIEVSTENPAFTVKDGVLFNKEMTTLYMYPSTAAAESYTVPEGVEEIASNAFGYNCDALHAVTLSSTVKTVYRDSFGLPHLEALNAADGNPDFSSDDGMLYNKDGTILYLCPKEKKGTVRIAGTARTIGAQAMESIDLDAADAVIIPEGVEKIEGGNFRSVYGNEGALQVYLPATLTEISEASFTENDKIVFHCARGSYAESFAIAHGIPYENA